MYGVCGNPYLNLDEYIDPLRVDALNDEILRGLCLSQLPMSEGSEYSRGDAAPSMYDHRFKDVATTRMEVSEEDQKWMNEKTDIQKQKYLMYKYGAYFPWGVIYNALSNYEWDTKNTSSGKKLRDKALDNFPNLIDLCYNCGIFSDIGRIVVFGNLPAQHGIVHRDRDPKKWDGQSEFLYLNPRRNKAFFIWDEETKTKHYVNATSSVFNDFDYHGMDTMQIFTYSIRVDGVYTSEWKNRVRFGKTNDLH
jgi:hypothetical protein